MGGGGGGGGGGGVKLIETCLLNKYAIFLILKSSLKGKSFCGGKLYLGKWQTKFDTMLSSRSRLGMFQMDLNGPRITHFAI